MNAAAPKDAVITLARVSQAFCGLGGVLGTLLLVYELTQPGAGSLVSSLLLVSNAFLVVAVAQLVIAKRRQKR